MTTAYLSTPPGGSIDAGTLATLTVQLSEAVTVTGMPTFTLSNNAVAAYDANASDPSSGDLVFDYTVGSNDYSAGLAVTGLSANGATVQDANGDNADFSSLFGATSGITVDSPLQVTSVTASQTGEAQANQTIQLTLTLNNAVTVNTAGGLPTLILNNNATATYDANESKPSAGSLVFDYTIGSADSTPNLSVMAVNLPNGTTVQDANGDNADFSAAADDSLGLQIGPTTFAGFGAVQTGNVDTGQQVTLWLATSGAVTVNTAAGSPTLTLNNNATAIYDANESDLSDGLLAFDYTPASTDQTPNLTFSQFNSNGASIQDLSAASNIPTGLTINSPLTITSIVPSQTGEVDSGETVQFVLNMSEGALVDNADGSPDLTLSDGATATYDSAASNPSTGTLVFDYTVGPDDHASNLAIDGVELNGASIQDANGNNADFSAASNAMTGLQIGPPINTVVSVSYFLANQSTLDAGGAFTIEDTAANVSAAIDAINEDAIVFTIALTDTGTPTLTLTAAQALNDTSALGKISNASYTIAIVDTAADVATGFDALNADTRISSITLTDSGVPTLTLSAAQALGDTAVLGKMSNANYAIAIVDTAANVAMNLNALNSDPQLASITLTDGATSPSRVSAQQVLNDTTALSKILGAYEISVVDTAADLETLSPAQIAALGKAGVGSITATDTSVVLSIATAVAYRETGYGINVPAGDAVTVADTAAAIASTTQAQADALKAAGYTSVASTDGAVTLSLAEALMLSGDGLVVTGGSVTVAGSVAAMLAVTAPQASSLVASGYALEVADTGVDIQALTPAKIANIAALHVKAVVSTNGSLAFTVTQAVAFENADIKLSAPSGSTVTISDTAAHLEALTEDEISALPAVGIASLVSNNGPVAFKVAQAVALETADVPVSALGASVALADSAAHIESLTAAEIVALPGLGFTDGSSTGSLVLTVVQALALEAIGFEIAVPSGDKIRISDAAANVAGLTTREIAALPAIGVTAIAATGAGVTLNVGQALALETAAITLAVPTGDIAAIADTAANIEAMTSAQIASLTTLHVTQLQATDAGVASSVALALALLTVKVSLSAPSGDQDSLIDTAAHIETLTAAQIASLASTLHVSAVAASDSSLAVTTAQAIAFESAHIALSAPAGSTVEVSDTAAHLQALTAAQIEALPTERIEYLNSANANVSYTAAQTSAILSAGLAVTAAGADTVTENFSNGNYLVYQSGHLIQEKSVNAGASYDIAYFDVTGQSYGSYENIYNTSGAKVADAEDMTNGSGTLILNGSGLTISSSSGAQSVTTGSDIFAINAHSTEAVTASGTTSDTFVYSADFGQDTITGFAATGTNHDTLQFSAAMFNYLTPGMTQAQDLAAVLSHATQVGSVATIFDTAGDSLALNAVTTTTLAANLSDSKFV